MLKNNLYILGKIAPQGQDHYSVAVTLDPQHKIFSGHFPQQPVLPGVCLLDMLKEMIREITGLPYALSEGKAIKYLKPVDPRHDPEIRFEVFLKTDGEDLSVNANSHLIDGEVNFKFKGVFSLIL